MAIYSVLSFKSAHDASDTENQVIDSIESRSFLPTAWIALFNSDQLFPNEFLAASSSADARKTIQERSSDLSAALGQEWQDGIERFMSRLEASEYVELNMQEWFGEPHDFEHFLKLQLSTFSEPLYSGEKHR